MLFVFTKINDTIVENVSKFNDTCQVEVDSWSFRERSFDLQTSIKIENVMIDCKISFFIFALFIIALSNSHCVSFCEQWFVMCLASLQMKHFFYFLSVSRSASVRFFLASLIFAESNSDIFSDDLSFTCLRARSKCSRVDLKLDLSFLLFVFAREEFIIDRNRCVNI